MPSGNNKNNVNKYTATRPLYHKINTRYPIPLRKLYDSNHTIKAIILYNWSSGHYSCWEITYNTALANLVGKEI